MAVKEEPPVAVDVSDWGSEPLQIIGEDVSDEGQPILVLRLPDRLSVVQRAKRIGQILAVTPCGNDMTFTHALIDLVVDTRHFARFASVDFEEVLELSAMHFTAEIDPTQDPLNCEDDGGLTE